MQGTEKPDRELLDVLAFADSDAESCRSVRGVDRCETHDPNEDVVLVGDHPVWTGTESAGEFVGGLLFGHGLVQVEVLAEAASDLAASPERRSPGDVAVLKLAQSHAFADQFGYVIDIHARQLRTTPWVVLRSRRPVPVLIVSRLCPPAVLRRTVLYE